MKIRSTDFVLEIGSGHNPNPRSDVLCDKAIEDDAERGGKIVLDRPMVEADAQNLPFADASFDYVICSHVLEHVEDPVRMLKELMRVASRGYIETPSEIAERLYGWPFHRSVISTIDGKLLIRRKDFVSPFGDLFHQLVARDRAFRRFHRTHPGLFLMRYEWEGRIEYEVTPESAALTDSALPATLETLRRRHIPAAPWRDRWLPIVKSLVPRPVAAWGKSALARLRPRPKKHLRDIIVCPACKGPVAWETARIRCERCGVDYPIIRGVPRLILRQPIV